MLATVYELSCCWQHSCIAQTSTAQIGVSSAAMTQPLATVAQLWISTPWQVNGTSTWISVLHNSSTKDSRSSAQPDLTMHKGYVTSSRAAKGNTSSLPSLHLSQIHILGATLALSFSWKTMAELWG